MSTRKPNSRERDALQRFMPGYIEDAGAFPGCGKKTFAHMVEMGWIEWVESPETFEEGYRITAEGERVRYL